MPDVIANKNAMVGNCINGILGVEVVIVIKPINILLFLAITVHLDFLRLLFWFGLSD